MVSSSPSSSEFDVITPIEAVGELPEVNRIRLSDLGDALKLGYADFRAMPTHAIFLGLAYAAAGLLIARIVFGGSLFTLLYPLATGFALIGPFAAIGLYELSRRREEGRDTHWLHVFDVRHSPSFRSILTLGAMLVGLFALWIATAHGIFSAYFGYPYHATLSEFLNELFTTSHGHGLMIVGNAVGLLFAVIAMAVSVVSFPLMLDRHVGVAAAVTTSLKSVLRNPIVMLAWGLIVSLGLLLGALPLFMGLAVVVPVLGHATWHLYRRLVAPDDRQRPQFKPRPHYPHSAADFPASLFVPSSLDPDDARY
ncbi:MAG: DUF2189 domain-containing protein [Hyphomicrobiaceae bacterium]